MHKTETERGDGVRGACLYDDQKHGVLGFVAFARHERMIE